MKTRMDGTVTISLDEYNRLKGLVDMERSKNNKTIKKLEENINILKKEYEVIGVNFFGDSLYIHRTVKEQYKLDHEKIYNRNLFERIINKRV